MIGDKFKQQARFNILEKLKQKQMPGKAPAETVTPDEAAGMEKEETLNDWGPSESLQQRINPNVRLRKKKRPGSEENMDATLPQNVTGSY